MKSSAVLKRAALAGIVGLTSLLVSCGFGNDLLTEIDSQVRESNGGGVNELTISASGNGTVVPEGSLTLTETDVLDISATADPSYTFLRWEQVGGAGTVAFGNATDGPTTVSLTDGDAAIQAVFTADTYQLSVISDGNGSVTPTDTQTVNDGALTAITATPATGYQFSNWEVATGVATVTDPNAVDTTVTLTSGNATIRAVFELREYSLTLTNDGNGTTSPSGTVTVQYDVPRAISADPSRYRSFDGWTYTGTGTAVFAGANDWNTTVKVTGGNVMVRANFKTTTYDLQHLRDIQLNSYGYLYDVYDMEVDGNYLYLAGSAGNGRGTVMRFNVSSGAFPSLDDYRTTETSNGRIEGLDFDGTYVYAADSTHGVYRFHKSSLNPYDSEKTQGGAVDVAIHGQNSSYLMVLGSDDHVRLYYESAGSLTSNPDSRTWLDLGDRGYRLEAMPFTEYAFVTAIDGDSGSFYSVSAGSPTTNTTPQLRDTLSSPFGGFGEAPQDLEILYSEIAYMTTSHDSLVAVWVDGLSSVDLAKELSMPGNGPHAVAVKEGAAEYSDGSSYTKTLLFTASAENQAYTLLDIENYGDPQPRATFGAQNTIPTNSDIAVVGDYLYSFEEDAGGTHRLSVYEIAIDP